MDDQVFLVAQGFIAILTGFIVEALKRAGLPTKYAMLTSAGCGLILGICAALLIPNTPLYIGVFGGLLAGAVASGFYAGGKAMIKK